MLSHPPGEPIQYAPPVANMVQIDQNYSIIF